MSATHQFAESNLVGEAETIPIANVNFGSVDEAEIVPASHPVIRGEASFEKYIRCKFTGTWTEISNMKLWRSDVLGYKTGETLKASANEVYVTPSATPNTDDDIPLNEGSALAIESAEGEVIIEYGATGVSGYTGYVRLQIHSTGSTPAGIAFQKTILFQYDEI